jgi:hypothetical protein
MLHDQECPPLPNHQQSHLSGRVAAWSSWAFVLAIAAGSHKSCPGSSNSRHLRPSTPRRNARRMNGTRSRRRAWDDLGSSFLEFSDRRVSVPPSSSHRYVPCLLARFLVHHIAPRLPPTECRRSDDVLHPIPRGCDIILSARHRAEVGFEFLPPVSSIQNEHSAPALRRLCRVSPTSPTAGTGRSGPS